MAAPALVWPGVALVATTYVVWLRMYVDRIGEMRRRRIHPQSVATRATAVGKLERTAAADNYANLFELPVVFYFGLAVALALHIEGAALLGLAWAYVALRVVHSAIHTGYNRVMHRFLVHVTSSLVLLAFWTALAVGLWQA